MAEWGHMEKCVNEIMKVGKNVRDFIIGSLTYPLKIYNTNYYYYCYCKLDF